MRFIILFLVSFTVRAALDNEVLGKYNQLQEETGCTFVISSGHRTPRKNKEVGGADNSYHLYGKAIDVVPKTCRYSIFRLAQIAHKYFNGVIYYDKHIHLDIRKDKYFARGTYEKRK
jgi:uncharacterized protein YcbK (DUF882 family)